MTPSRAAAWAVHVLTASGAVLALAAVAAATRGDLQACFAWLFAATVIDGVDGWLARAARVKAHAPLVDGATMDNIVDYLTYVFVPAWLIWHGTLVPAAFTWPVAAAVLVSSAWGFSRTDAKTADHFFTGFPSYWNIVVFYLLAARVPAGWNAAILIGLAVLVFVPIRYVYPSRTPVLRRLTLWLAAAWAATLLAMLWQWPAIDGRLIAVSALYPLYYTGLSLALHTRRV